MKKQQPNTINTLQDFLYEPHSKVKDWCDQNAHLRGIGCWLWVPPNPEGKVCIVAHIDTVHAKDRPTPVFHDEKKGVMWSPTGLGADDRAGVYAAMTIWNNTPDHDKPYILLTDGEESGGWGAHEAVAVFRTQLEQVLCFIELDRCGVNDCVFYSGESKEFRQMVESYGFKAAHGSFSDISILAPAFFLCGVNLSIGFHNEHSKSEWLDVGAMHNNIGRTVEMVRNIQNDGKAWDNNHPQQYSMYYDDYYPYTTDTYYMETDKWDAVVKHMPKEHRVDDTLYYCVCCDEYFGEDYQGIPTQAFCPGCGAPAEVEYEEWETGEEEDYYEVAEDDIPF